MAKTRQVELANLVVRYGANVLLDEFRRTVWPAVKDGVVKGRGETEKYFFHESDVALINGEPVWFGRLIAKKRLESEQDFDEERQILHGSDSTLSCAPSSLFVVSLADHKIAFLRESRRSPSIKDFEYCVRRLLMRDWKLKIEGVRAHLMKEKGVKRLSSKMRKEFMSKVLEEYPEPTVRVTALPSKKSIERHLEAYKLITQLTLIPLKTNDEHPDENDQFIASFTAAKERTNSESARVNLANGKTGLNKPAVEELVGAAANGNYEAKLRGKDELGQDIHGDLESLAIKIDLDVSEDSARKTKAPASERSRKIFAIMKHAFSRGLVEIIEAQEQNLDKAKRIVKAIKDGADV